MTNLFYKCRLCGARFSKQSNLNFGSGVYNKVNDNQLFASHHCGSGAWGLADLLGEKANTAEEEFGAPLTTEEKQGYA